MKEIHREIPLMRMSQAKVRQEVGQVWAEVKQIGNGSLLDRGRESLGQRWGRGAWVSRVWVRARSGLCQGLLKVM